MAPPKVPKKPLKFMEKNNIEKPISKTKKQKKRNYGNYSIYIYKVLKIVTQNRIGITSKSMMIMNNFVHDTMEKLAAEAGRLVAHTKRNTMGSREIQSAVKLVIPGELAKHAAVEGLRAITAYHSNNDTHNK